MELSDNGVSLSPLLPAKTEPVSQVTSPLDIHPTTAPTILIVDDDAMLRLLLTQCLRLANYRVVTANSGMEALALFNQHQIQLVIVDLMMPGMNGFLLCQELRKHSAKVPILIISAFSSKVAQAQALCSGANAYLKKPVRLTQLHQMVHALLTEGSGCTEQQL